jgi:hypothetical protein
MENTSLEAASAAIGGSSGAEAYINALGNLLKYGVPGLALAIIIVCFVSLHSLQKQSLGGTVPIERIAPFERLQKLYLFVSFAVFCISIIAPPVIDRAFPQQAPQRKVQLSFALSPTLFDPADLAPTVVDIGGGNDVEFKRGAAHAVIEGDKTYGVNVEKLVKTIDNARFLALQAQLRRDGVQGERGALQNR